jgi:hypothetical protein
MPHFFQLVFTFYPSFIIVGGPALAQANSHILMISKKNLYSWTKLLVKWEK